MEEDIKKDIEDNEEEQNEEKTEVPSEAPKVPTCQSCGLPMKTEEDFGTNENLTPNSDYCKYCYQQGMFTEPTMTALDMAERVKKMMVDKMNMSEEQAANAASAIPELKRWQQGILENLPE